MTEFRAQYPSAYESVGKARRAVVAFASNWFRGDELNDIESAVGEALANCAEHGHRQGGEIEIRGRYAADEISIEIKDTGTGFERWSSPRNEEPVPHATRGYGMFIMRRVMDEIEYADRGTRLRLIKRRSAHPIG